MNAFNKEIPEELVPEVLALASRYYSENNDSYSTSELIEAGAEVSIPPIFIEQAIKEVEKQRQQKLDKQKQREKQRQRLLQIGVGILVVSSLWSILTYNGLATSRSNVDAAWAQVENQLQRRADLIPQLISITQASADHEKALVADLRESRQAYLDAQTPEEKVLAVEKIDQSIIYFHQYMAANPQLQSTQLYTNLQYEIAGTENRISVERMRYNQSVQSYNQTINQFPNSLVGKLFGFETQPFYKSQIEQ